MTNSAHASDSGDQTGATADDSSTRYPGTPVWVKVFVVIVIVLVLLVSIVIVTGIGGMHGPARHIPSSSNVPYTLAVVVGA